jgi:hypothetical protein
MKNSRLMTLALTGLSFVTGVACDPGSTSGTGDEAPSPALAAGASNAGEQIVWYQGREHRYWVEVGADQKPTMKESPERAFVTALAMHPSLGVVLDAHHPERVWAYTSSADKAAAMEAYRAFARQAYAGEIQPVKSDVVSQSAALQTSNAAAARCNVDVDYYDGDISGANFRMTGCQSNLNLHNTGWGDRIGSVVIYGGDPNSPAYVNMFQDGNFGGRQITLTNVLAGGSEWHLSQFRFNCSFIFFCDTFNNSVSSIDQWQI